MHSSVHPARVNESSRLFGLAPCGVYHAACITAGAVRSYRTFSPLPHRFLQRERRYRLCGTGRRCILKHSSRALPGTLPIGVRTFLPRLYQSTTSGDRSARLLPKSYRVLPSVTITLHGHFRDLRVDPAHVVAPALLRPDFPPVASASLFRESGHPWLLCQPCKCELCRRRSLVCRHLAQRLHKRWFDLHCVRLGAYWLSAYLGRLVHRAVKNAFSQRAVIPIPNSSSSGRISFSGFRYHSEYSL